MLRIIQLPVTKHRPPSYIRKQSKYDDLLPKFILPGNTFSVPVIAPVRANRSSSIFGCHVADSPVPLRNATFHLPGKPFPVCRLDNEDKLKIVSFMTFNGNY